VPAAIQFQAEHDWPRERSECHELLREARRRIEKLGRGMPRPYEAICPDSPEWYAQMAAFPLPACDAAALQRRLYDEHRVEVPVIEWPVPCGPGTGNGRQLVRVSVQGYNIPGDVDASLEALKARSPTQCSYTFSTSSDERRQRVKGRDWFPALRCFPFAVTACKLAS
jgi:isopenicillin-N epimerase